MTAPRHTYVVAIGSNMAHPRHGRPVQVVRAAILAMDAGGLHVVATAPIIASAPLGPSRRRYANGAAVITTARDPVTLLDRLQAIETEFGRNRRGQRWRARTLDLDIILWSAGAWHDRRLVIPHREYRHRLFVLGPMRAIAADWRDPVTGLKVKHTHARLTRRAHAPKGPLPHHPCAGP